MPLLSLLSLLGLFVVFICLFYCNTLLTCCYLVFFFIFAKIGLVETDPEGALAGFAEVVSMEPEKAEWWVP